jgi:signal transduction histidine kinase
VAATRRFELPFDERCDARSSVRDAPGIAVTDVNAATRTTAYDRRPLRRWGWRGDCCAAMRDMRMRDAIDEMPIPGAGIRDLATFNRWLCMTRLRAAAGVMLIVIVLDALDRSDIATWNVVIVCALLSLVTVFGLVFSRATMRSWTFLTVQTLCDLTAITVGIAVSAHGETALLFSLLFVIAVVPPSLLSVRAGLAVATVAAVCHGLLLVIQNGFAVQTIVSVRFLVPVAMFYLVAQQCFFYGQHLAKKNAALAALGERLDRNRDELATEARTSAALVEVARTLGVTLDAPELLARVNRTMLNYAAADWAATFLVDADRGTFRLAATSDAERVGATLTLIEFPVTSWSALARLDDEDVVTLAGADAAGVPAALTGGRTLGTVLLAKLRSHGRVAGFLAVGYSSGRDDTPAAVRLLAGIAEHAAIVLHNAYLLDEVRKASQLKSEFVGAISHELRSPLNVILGYVEMMSDDALGPVSDAQRDALKRTRDQALALLEMIVALLDLNRLEAGRLPVENVPVEVDALLAEVIEQLPDNWRRPSVEVRLERAAEPLPRLATDRGKLKTVVRNLVHNALKFTDHGHVTVSAARTPTGDIAIRVRDTGRGIPPDARAYIFDMFRQVPNSGGGGVGLGLHLVRRLVDALGGTVDLESEVDVGTCFVLTLPVRDEGSATAA